MMSSLAELEGKVDGKIGKTIYLSIYLAAQLNNSYLSIYLFVSIHLSIYLSIYVTHTAALCVVGNKCDLTGEREVPKDRGEAFAHQLGALFTETSAAENMGILHHTQQRIIYWMYCMYVCMYV